MSSKVSGVSLSKGETSEAAVSVSNSVGAISELRSNLRTFVVKGKRLIWTKQEERGCLFYLLTSERR